MTAPERPASQEPTAQEHADTVREVVRRLSGTRDVPAIDFALDALLALLAEAERERDDVHRSYVEQCAETTMAWGKFQAAEAALAEAQTTITTTGL